MAHELFSGYKMKSLQGIRKIGVFGHVGNENLGDEAIIAAVIQNIRRRYPNADICGFTINPEDTRRRHKIAAFPIRKMKRNPQWEKTPINRIADDYDTRSFTVKERTKAVLLRLAPRLYSCLRGISNKWFLPWDLLRELSFLIQCYRKLKDIDLLIIAGSQQLIDYVGGPWAFPYTLWKWVSIAKATHTKVSFVSVGAGPIHSHLGRLFIRTSLAQAAYRSFRDEASRELVKNLGVCGENNILADLVFSLETGSPSTTERGEPLHIVGINPIPFRDGHYWLGANPDRYESYTRKVASFAIWLTQKGYKLLFFPTQLRADPPVIADIIDLMKCQVGPEIEQKLVHRMISSLEDLISAIDMTDVVLATRFHGVVIPYLRNKPVLGIAYQRKTMDLMSQLDQSDYVVDINSFDVECLKARFILMESNLKSIGKELAQRNTVFRSALQDQYDQVLSLA
jgi:polysaccharide pyruvyl transferase WcaK-like protein